jgi:hypothetical protein
MDTDLDVTRLTDAKHQALRAQTSLLVRERGKRREEESHNSEERRATIHAL